MLLAYLAACNSNDTLLLLTLVFTQVTGKGANVIVGQQN